MLVAKKIPKKKSKNNIKMYKQEKGKDDYIIKNI